MNAHLKTLDFFIAEHNALAAHTIYGEELFTIFLDIFIVSKTKSPFGALVSVQTEFREMLSLQNSLGLVAGCLLHGEECQILWR